MTTEDGGLLALIAAEAEAARLRVALIGGTAVNAWAEPRFTRDIDLTVVADAAAIEAFCERMALAGFERSAVQGEGASSGPDFIRLRRGPEIVELQAAKTTLQEAVLKRAVRRPDSSLPVATAEDLLLLTLISNRHIDQVDVRELAALPGLDWPYIQEWADEWGITARLEALRGTTNR